MENDCLLEEDVSSLNNLPLSMAYVPIQAYTEPVSPEEGLCMGTVWKDLYRPFKEAAK